MEKKLIDQLIHFVEKSKDINHASKIELIELKEESTALIKEVQLDPVKEERDAWLGELLSTQREILKKLPEDPENKPDEPLFTPSRPKI